jgi:flagellar hook-length control protein FliK
MEWMTTSASVQTNTAPKTQQGNKSGEGNSILFADLLSQISGNQKTSDLIEGPSVPQALSLWIPTVENMAPEQLGQALEELYTLLQSLSPALTQQVMDSEAVKDWMSKVSTLFKQQEPTIASTVLPSASLLNSNPLIGDVLSPLKNLIQKISATPAAVMNSSDIELLAEEIQAITKTIKQSTDSSNELALKFKQENGSGNLSTSTLNAPIGVVQQSRTDDKRRLDPALKFTSAVSGEMGKGPESGLLIKPKWEPTLLPKDTMASILAGTGTGTETASEVSLGDAASSAQNETSESLLQWLKTSKLQVDGKPMEPIVKIPIQQFAEEFTRFANSSLKLTTFAGLSEAKISLTPEHLGHVDIRLTTQQGQVVAHFAAETLAAREMIENQLPQLRASLMQQGLQVDKITVSQAHLSSGMFHDQQKGQSFYQPQQQQKQQSSKINADLISGYDLFFENDMAATNVRLNLSAGSGNQFDATA